MAKYIKPGTLLQFRLSKRERDLVIERAFLDSEIEAPLRAAAVAGSSLAVQLTLDDLDDLHGCVAAEANHCDDDKVRRTLDAICNRLGALEDQFTGEAPSQKTATETARPRFTPKQGQYLAFIYYFTKIHGRAPAEADFRLFFKVSPPVIHQMILTLERRGLISRTPGKARSVGLQVARVDLPELE